MELQVQIDDVSACPGRCPGCALSASERRATAPDMAPAVLAAAINAVGDYARATQPSSVNVTFGIADHLLIGEHYVHEIYRQTATRLAAEGYTGERATIFFSASLIAARAVAERQVAYLTSIPLIGGIPLIPVVVVDPQNLKHRTFGDQWRAFADLANRSFGRIDLAMNLSGTACQLMTPEEMVDYVRTYGFKEVTINWTPTPDNRINTASDLRAIEDWLIGFAELADAAEISYSYGPVMSRSAHAIRCSQEETDLTDVVAKVVDRTIRHSIHIDANGALYPKFEAIGDVPHSPRFGYPALGNVTKDSVLAILDANLPVIERRVIAAHVRDRRCVDCPYMKACAITGFHIYSYVLGPKSGDGQCPHVARRLWEYTFGSLSDPEGPAATAAN